MHTVESQQALKELLLTYPDDRSFSIAFVGQVPSADDMLAVRQAARLCDIVVVAVQGASIEERFKPYFEQAGADIVFADKAFNAAPVCKVLAYPKADDATFFLQNILLIFPLVVTVSALRQEDVQKLKALSTQFKDLFELVVQEVGTDILSVPQRKLREALITTKEALLGGEVSVSMLESLFHKKARDLGLSGSMSLEVVADDLTAIRTVKQYPVHLFARAMWAGEWVHDGLKVYKGKAPVSALQKSGTYV